MDRGNSLRSTTNFRLLCWATPLVVRAEAVGTVWTTYLSRSIAPGTTFYCYSGVLLLNAVPIYWYNNSGGQFRDDVPTQVPPVPYHAHKRPAVADVPEEEDTIRDELTDTLSCLYAKDPMSVEDPPEENATTEEPTDEDFCVADETDDAEVVCGGAKDAGDNDAEDVSCEHRAKELKKRLMWVGRILVNADTKCIHVWVSRYSTQLSRRTCQEARPKASGVC
ncbi:unnamed protein product [Phytophthora fragariaefolia]|uniref:Unnamed protein product n=1 Tax=Phytophthora fragariaefolia TaxID=1490495 RepID=A0A9W7CVR7_9STRA|nr:unnamed protein product [Phytophthora fragariaefolia]